MPDILTVRYAQTGKSTTANAMGMRDMQARAYEKRMHSTCCSKLLPFPGNRVRSCFLPSTR